VHVAKNNLTPTRLIAAITDDTVTYSFCDTISLPMAVGLYLWQARLPAWNSLCDELREPSLAADSFRQLLKTRLFAEY